MHSPNPQNPSIHRQSLHERWGRIIIYLVSSSTPLFSSRNGERSNSFGINSCYFDSFNFTSGSQFENSVSQKTRTKSLSLYLMTWLTATSWTWTFREIEVQHGIKLRSSDVSPIMFFPLGTRLQCIKANCTFIFIYWSWSPFSDPDWRKPRR